jgi:hypothetical protein
MHHDKKSNVKIARQMASITQSILFVLNIARVRISE